jgi:hypothetical protein
MVLKIVHLKKWIRSALKVLKCGAGGWRRSVGLTDHVRNDDKLQTVNKTEEG